MRQQRTSESQSDEGAASATWAALPPLASPPRTVFVRARHGAQSLLPRLPGSKYYTLRYLLNALLADGESLVRFPALSDDTAVLVAAIRALGATASWERDTADPSRWALRIVGCAGRPQPPPSGVLSVGNAGAVLRLLLGIGALLPEVHFETDHPHSLGRRPNADLLAALAALGVSIEAQGADGLLPITVRGGPPRGGTVTVSGARSSQYLSALLYLAPLLPDGLTITVPDTLRSAPLIRATLRALAAAGINVEASDDLRQFVVPGSQTYRATVYDVPADGPSAAALAAAALAMRTPLRLEHLPADEDDIVALVSALDALAAPLTQRPSHSNGGALALEAGGYLHGARVNGDTCIDSVPVLAAATCFAEGETRFENVATLRLKESDRIADLCAELHRAGCDVDPLPDTIVVRGQPQGIAGGATVDGHDDHRLVQALAIVALRSCDGLTITGADAVAKSYPWFFEDLERMGAEITSLS